MHIIYILCTQTHLCVCASCFLSYAYVCMSMSDCVYACMHCILADLFSHLFVWPNGCAHFEHFQRPKKQKNVRLITVNNANTDETKTWLKWYIHTSCCFFFFYSIFSPLVYCFLYRCSCYFWVFYFQVQYVPYGKRATAAAAAAIQHKQ